MMETSLRVIYRILLSLLIFPFVAGWANAQILKGGPLSPAEPLQELTVDGIVVDSIVIDNRNIFDTDTKQYNYFIFKTANKLHYKTRCQVIEREVLLEVGKPYSPELAEETARNLRQRLQLYDAWIETEKLANGHLLVRIVTIDEWTFSSRFTINRDGNEIQYKLGFAERNFLGNNQYLSVEYFIQPSYDNYIVAGFTDERFFGNPYAVEIRYKDDPLGQLRQVSFSHPYYNLTQRYLFGLSIASTGGRREIYNENRLVGHSNNDGDLTFIHGAYRLGTYTRKIQFSTGYTYRFEQTYDQTITTEAKDAEDTSQAIMGFPADSLYHQVGVGVNLSNFDFIKLKQIDGFGYTEDFVLGQAVQISLARAYTNNFHDNLFDLFETNLSLGHRYGPSLALLTYNRQLWLKGNKDIRRVTKLMGNYYYSPFHFLTIAARGTYESDWRDNGAEAVVVSGRGDVRGFNKVFSTGGRKGVFNLEGRFYPNIEILSLRLGGVVFIDMARSWRSDESLMFRGFSGSVGAGVRVAFERSSKNKLLRIDVAYSEKYGWQLSIGTNQYFMAH